MEIENKSQNWIAFAEFSGITVKVNDDRMLPVLEQYDITPTNTVEDVKNLCQKRFDTKMLVADASKIAEPITINDTIHDANGSPLPKIMSTTTDVILLIISDTEEKLRNALFGSMEEMTCYNGGIPQDHGFIKP